MIMKPGDHMYNTYDIIFIDDNTEVECVGGNYEWILVDVWFKMSRYSISEGIFESKLASRAGVIMRDGNVYSLNIYGKIMYIYIDKEYAYFGTSICANPDKYK